MNGIFLGEKEEEREWRRCIQRNRVVKIDKQIEQRSNISKTKKHNYFISDALIYKIDKKNYMKSNTIVLRSR